MKYLISYLPTEYVIKGIFIPRKGYSREELAQGKREVIAVSEQQLNLLETSPLFQTFIATKKMRVLDKAPENLLSGEERMAKLLAENKALKAEAMANRAPAPDKKPQTVKTEAVKPVITETKKEEVK